MTYTEQDVEEFQEETQILLKKGLIRESFSQHSSPAFYVNNHNEKKRGKRRMVIDYRKKNEATIGNAQNLPRKEYLIKKLRGAKYFSALDAKSGYWQIRLHENTKPLTAFTCQPQKHFEWNVLPFGLKQAPGIFQQFMDNNLIGYEEFSSVYIDDIIIFTKSDEKDHLEKVYRILERCKEKGLVLSQKKAQILKQKIEFLGLEINSNGTIIAQKHILEKINQFPYHLQDRKQMQRFLGNLNYLADQGLFKNLAKQKKTLQQKISEKIPWKWTEEDSKVVERLKEMCNKLPELYNPSDDDILIVSTEACITHWGATLTALCGKKSEIVERIKELITQKTSLK